MDSFLQAILLAPVVGFGLWKPVAQHHFASPNQ
jgi:hypothetical protein